MEMPIMRDGEKQAKVKWLNLRVDAELLRRVKYHCLNDDKSMQEYVVGLIKKDIHWPFEEVKVK